MNKHRYAMPELEIAVAASRCDSCRSSTRPTAEKSFMANSRAGAGHSCGIESAVTAACTCAATLGMARMTCFTFKRAPMCSADQPAMTLMTLVFAATHNCGANSLKNCGLMDSNSAWPLCAHVFMSTNFKPIECACAMRASLLAQTTMSLALRTPVDTQPRTMAEANLPNPSTANV